MKDIFDKLKKRVKQFVQERKWDNYHNPKNLSMSIAIEAAELMEIFQWLTIQESNEIGKNEKEFIHLQEEIADIMIYCISLANQLNINLERAINNKVDKNEIRFKIPTDSLSDINK